MENATKVQRTRVRKRNRCTTKHLGLADNVDENSGEFGIKFVLGAPWFAMILSLGSRTLFLELSVR